MIKPLKIYLLFVLTTIAFIFSCRGGEYTGPNSSNFDLDKYKTLMQTMFMIPVEGDTFLMGDGDGVNVTLSDYYICDHEVTQAEYETIVGSNPSCNNCANENSPVDFVSWYNAIVYCNMLSIAKNLTPCYAIDGKTDPAEWGDDVPTASDPTWNTVTCDFEANGFRLPTEAEWEFAARGGKESQGYVFAGVGTDFPTESYPENADEIIANLCEILNPYAWFMDNSESVIHIVKTKLPNELDLYDMSGNVAEWCWDWYAANLTNDSTNPTGPASGNMRVNRGGSITNVKTIPGLRFLKTNYRSMMTSAVPQKTGHGLGFRIARSCR